MKKMEQQQQKNRLDKKTRRMLAKQRKTLERNRQMAWKRRQIFIFWSLGLFIALGSGFGFYQYVQYQQNNTFFPPTSILGHVEAYPNERISSEPIPLVQQKHILEHVPGGQPGVLIQYNCQQFECPLDLVDRLMFIVSDFPNVYLAPHPKLGAMITLSALGKLKLLENLDEKQVYLFLRSYL